MSISSSTVVTRYLKVAFVFDEELDSWIHFATTMGAQVVDLQLYQGYGGSDDLYVFPHELLPCGSSGLKHLSLLSCVLSPPSDSSS